MIASLFLAASAGGLLSVLIHLLVIALVCWLLWWLIGFIGLPEPFNKVARAIVAVIAVVLVINLLLGLTGNGFIDL